MGKIKSITIEQIEFVLGAVKSISDKITISGLDYYVVPSVIFDDLTNKLKNHIEEK